MTPEGRVKRLVTLYLDELRDRLDEYGCTIHVTMPVPGGYGRHNMLDYHICFAGRLVVIETKAPREWLTPQQRIHARDLLRSGATVFLISGKDGLEAFKRWVDRNWHLWADV